MKARTIFNNGYLFSAAALFSRIEAAFTIPAFKVVVHQPDTLE